MASKTRKATFKLHEDVLAALDDAVARGAAASKDALIEQALVRQLRALRGHPRRERWEAAARDPLFLEDLAELHPGVGPPA